MDRRDGSAYSWRVLNSRNSRSPSTACSHRSNSTTSNLSILFSSRKERRGEELWGGRSPAIQWAVFLLASDWLSLFNRSRSVSLSLFSSSAISPASKHIAQNETTEKEAAREIEHPPRAAKGGDHPPMELRSCWLAILLCLALVGRWSRAADQSKSVLFVGYTNTFVGSSQTNGFVSLFKEETSSTTGVEAVALPFSGTDSLSRILQTENVATQRYDKIFLVVEADAILAEYEDVDVTSDLFSRPVTETNAALVKLESLLALLKSRSSDVEMDVLLLAGEDANENRLEEHFNAWRAALRRASVDYGVSYFDFAFPITKHLEIINLDNLDHSLLTYEGNILNERGHLLVAHELLARQGVRSVEERMRKAMQDALPKESVRDDVLAMQRSINSRASGSTRKP